MGTDRPRIPATATPPSLPAMRIAAALAAFTGLGFGIPCALGIWHFARTGEVWTFLGFPTYGKGPLEKAGISTSVPLLGTFLVVCAAEVVTAGLLWRRSRAGTRMSLGLLPAELIFWAGFGLPFGPPLALARTVTIFYATHQERPD